MITLPVAEPAVKVMSGTTVELEATISAAVTPVTNSGAPLIEYRGDSVFLSPETMKVGELYVFRLDDVPVIAKKQEDGSIDFFHAP